MHVRGVVFGRNNVAGYLVYDGKGGTAVAVDAPPGVTRRYLEICAANDVRLAMIVNTHGHWEQIADNVALVEASGAPLCAHVWDATRMANPEYTMLDNETFTVRPSRADRSLHNGEVLEIGVMRFEVMHTPGHSPGSICLYERSQGILFSGDTLLRQLVGRTDIPGGTSRPLKLSLLKLCDLPDATRVFPAHGPTTTIKEERWLLELAQLDEVVMRDA